MAPRFRGRENLAFACLLLFGLLSFWQLSVRHSTIQVKELTLESLRIDSNEGLTLGPDDSSLVETEFILEAIRLEMELSSRNRQKLIETLFPKMINEAFDTSYVNQAPVAYHIFRLSILNGAAKMTRHEQREELERYRGLIRLLDEGADVGGAGHLFVIPVDPLAWMKEAGSADYEQTLQAFCDYLNRARHYVRFKGSDHVFVCMSESCQSLGEDLARMLSGDLGSRAIFAAPHLDVERLKWPCPLRVIHLSQPVLPHLDVAIEAILKAASVMVEKKNRWACSDSTQQNNYFGDGKNKDGIEGVYVEEHGFFLCQVPNKVESASLEMLLRRLLHQQDWNSIRDERPRISTKFGFMHFADSDNRLPIQAIPGDPDVITAAFVEHPIPRLLSSYLENIVVLKNYDAVGHLPKYVAQYGVPSFPEFVDFLIEMHPDPNKLGEHFLPQSSSCGLRSHRFDFVGSLSELGPEIEEFSKSLDFWDKYVQSGWGIAGNQSFGVHSYQTSQTGTGNKIWEYYTEDLMKKVYEYYKEDFDRFGFTVAEALAIKPRQP